MIDLVSPPAVASVAPDIRRLCGNIPDHQVLAIIDAEASPDDIERALLWIHGNDEVLALSGQPLRGVARAVYDILAPEAAGWDEEA